MLASEQSDHVTSSSITSDTTARYSRPKTGQMAPSSNQVSTTSPSSGSRTGYSFILVVICPDKQAPPRATARGKGRKVKPKWHQCYHLHRRSCKRRPPGTYKRTRAYPRQHVRRQRRTQCQPLRYTTEPTSRTGAALTPHSPPVPTRKYVTGQLKEPTPMAHSPTVQLLRIRCNHS